MLRAWKSVHFQTSGAQQRSVCSAWSVDVGKDSVQPLATCYTLICENAEHCSTTGFHAVKGRLNGRSESTKPSLICHSRTLTSS